jgi:hypothetical protein
MKSMDRQSAQSTAPKRYRSQWLADVFARKTSENHKKNGLQEAVFLVRLQISMIFKDF